MKVKSKAKGDPKLSKEYRFALRILLDEAEHLKNYDCRMSVGQMVDAFCKEKLIDSNGFKVQWDDTLIDINMNDKIKELTKYGIDQGDTLLLFQ